MTQMIVSFLLDIVVATLLLVTIVYCWRLNNRIRTLQDSKGELAHLIRQFDESTERASQGMMDLQATGKKITESIASKIEKANYIADDLSFMIEKGSKIADQMENALASSRGKPQQPDMAQRAAAVPTKPTMTTPSPAQSPVTQKPAMTSYPLKNIVPSKPAGSINATQSKAASSLETVLERVSGRTPETTVNTFTEPSRKPVAGATVRLRSKAEQELFDALKASRQ